MHTSTYTHAATYTIVPEPKFSRGFHAGPIVLSIRYDGTRAGLVAALTLAVPRFMEDHFEVPGCTGKLLLNDSVRVNNRMGEHVITLSYLVRFDY